MKLNKPSYREGQEVKGKIEQDRHGNYFMMDERGIKWYTDEATAEGYYLSHDCEKALKNR